MRGVLSVAREELAGLTRHWTGMLLVLLALPLVVLLAVRSDRVTPVRLLVAGGPASVRPEPSFERLIKVLRESSALEISRQPQAEADPLARLARGRFDLLLNYGEAGTKDLSIYTAETDPLRVDRLESLGGGILRLYAFLRLRSQPEGEDLDELFPDVSWAKIPIYEELFMFGSFPVNPLFEYFPQAVEPRSQLFPATIALILGVVPFALGVAAGLASGPRRRTWGECATLAFGKALLPCLVALMNFIVMLLVIESFGGFHVKAGAFRFLLLLVPALFAGAFLGLSMAWLARTPLELVTACMLYGLALVLMGGFTAPVREGLELTRVAAELLPTTLVRPALGRWMFGATLDLETVKLGGRLALQSLLYGALAVGALRWRSREAASVHALAGEELLRDSRPLGSA